LVDSQEQQQEWVKKIKFHASLPPSQQLTSYRDFDESKENQETVSGAGHSEPVYANVSNGAEVSGPPLPETQPPPAWTGGHQGAAGARQILKQSSRQSLHTHDSSGPLYANVGSNEQDFKQPISRSSTLPSHRSSDSGDTYDNVSSSSKEKKSSVLGRFLGRKNK